MNRCLLLSALFVVASHGILTRPLSDLGTIATVAATSSSPDTTLPLFISLTGPATYDATSGTNFNIIAMVNHTGVVPIDRVYAFIESSKLTESLQLYAYDSSNPSVFTYGTALKVPAGTYSVSLYITNGVGKILSLSTSNLAAAGAYSSFTVTGNVAFSALTGLVIPSPQDPMCTGSTCTGLFRYNATCASPACFAVDTYFAGPSPNSVTYLFTGGQAVSGEAVVAQDITRGYPGFWTSGGFQELTGCRVGGYIVSQGTYTLVGMELDATGQVYTELSGSDVAGLSFPTSVTFSTGTTDVDPPTCTSVTVAPTTVSTTTTSTTFTATIGCTDTSGVDSLMVFYQGANSDTGTQIAANAGCISENNVVTVTVPPQISTTYSVIGLIAIDNAGNGVLYGSLGTLASQYSALGLGSSASTLFVSFTTLILGFIAVLFAQ